MKFDEINPIPTIDMSKVMDGIKAKIDQYPKGSLSEREIVESVDLGNMSFEEAQKAMDDLNAEVTKTIQSFIGKITKTKGQ